MTHSNAAAALSIGLLAIGGSALAQQPPDVVQSDSAENTAMGTGALALLSVVDSGYYASFDNTATGFYALYSNTTGAANTASGSYAMYQNTTGGSNTAFGGDALSSNTTGGGNVAVGQAALVFNKTGESNTATGASALANMKSGNSNTAVGFSAMAGTITGAMGSDNTAIGSFALSSFSTGSYNAAVGQNSLYSATTGSSNAAFGYAAMTHNISGNANVAIGLNALKNSIAGSNNIALGNAAGSDIDGSNNIDIGNIGVSSDNYTIRIGTSGTHSATYIQGIYEKPVKGLAVYITSTGQLGTVVSSERFKTDIKTITATEKLSSLRPVTFHLKTDPHGPLQYGLIAEEVAKVYPDLVVRDEGGRIDGVRYDELAPMLLNELQKQATEIRDLKEKQNRSAVLADQLRTVQRQLAVMQTAFSAMQLKEERVAQQ